MSPLLHPKFEPEIAQLRDLRNCAAAIVDYVHTITPGSTFQRYTEWTLEPDNWISMRLRLHSVVATSR